MRTLHDFNGGGRTIPQRGRLQDMTEAIRELDRRNSYDTSTVRRYDLREMFLAVIQANGGGSLGNPTPDYSDERYYAQRSYPSDAEDDETFDLTPDVEKVPDFPDDKTVIGNQSYTLKTDQNIYTVINIREMNDGTHLLLPGDNIIVNVFFDRGQPIAKHYVCDVAPVGWRIVDLANDGGADGAVPSTPATWTYAAAYNGKTLGTHLAVIKPRLFNAPTTVATKGIAYIDNIAIPSAWKLWDAGETFANTTCAGA